MLVVITRRYIAQLDLQFTNGSVPPIKVYDHVPEMLREAWFESQGHNPDSIAADDTLFEWLKILWLVTGN